MSTPNLIDVVLFGKAGSGKTTLWHTLLDHENEKTSPTESCNVGTVALNSDSKSWNFRVWDTPPFTPGLMSIFGLRRAEFYIVLDDGNITDQEMLTMIEAIKARSMKQNNIFILCTKKDITENGPVGVSIFDPPLNRLAKYMGAVSKETTHEEAKKHLLKVFCKEAFANNFIECPKCKHTFTKVSPSS